MSKKLLIIAGVLMIVLLLAGVSALGVTPARTTLNFKPGEEQTISFSIINSESRDMNLVVYVQGELNKSVGIIGENSFEMKSGEENKQMSYTFKMPQTLNPGLHTADVVIMQLPGKSGTSEAFVGAAVAVVTQIYVYVPYPGKYAESDMSVVNAEQGGEATFIIPVVSRGNLDLVSVKANIDVYNKMGEKVGSFNTAEISVPSGEKKDIVAKWKADVPVGMYRAVATLMYDGESLQLEKQFSVGSQDLDLQQVEVKDFSLGEIAKFEMLIENKWSEPISQVYAQTQIFDNEGKVMADFKSATYDIEPLTKTVMVSYWDTAGVRVGTYDSSVFLRYGQKSSQKDFKLKVSEQEIEIIGLGYVISSEKPAKNTSWYLILGAVIGVLILINLSWFLVLRKFLKKRSASK